jgi:hypothetical protein
MPTNGGFDPGFKARCVKGYLDWHPDVNGYTDMADDGLQSPAGAHYNISTEVELNSGEAFVPQVGMAGQAYPVAPHPFGARYIAPPRSPMMFDYVSGTHGTGYTAYLRQDFASYLPFATNAFHWFGLCDYQDKGGGGVSLGFANTAITALTSGVALLANTSATLRVLGATVTAAGTGYTTAPAVAFTGGTGTAATAHATISGGVVTGLIVDTPGSYSVAPTGITLTGGGGTGATMTPIGGTGNLYRIIVGLLVTYPVLTVSTVPLGVGGSGYSAVTPPTFVMSGGTGGGATGHGTVVSGAVTGWVLDTPGSYTVAPTGITITHNGGSGATGGTPTTATVQFFGAIDFNRYVSPGFPKDAIYTATGETFVRAAVQGVSPSWYGFVSCDATFYGGSTVLVPNAGAASTNLSWSAVVTKLTTDIDKKVGSDGVTPNAASGTTFLPRPKNGLSSVQIKGINYAIETSIPTIGNTLAVDLSLAGMTTVY